VWSHDGGLPCIWTARVFSNAAIRHGVSAASYARARRFCHVLSFERLELPPWCSVLVGSSEFIARADSARKRIGGGMRQAGIIAACGVVALESMIDRLAEDHANAATSCALV